MIRGLNTSMPIYVSRKTAHGETAEYSLSLWMTVLVIMLAWLNAVAWGCLGLYFAVTVIL